MLSLRLVLDTNVVISAALRPAGLQRTVLLLAMTKPARWYVSDAILSEYREVLTRPEFKIPRGLRTQLLQLIRNRAHLIRPECKFQAAADPDDNKFLECADVARADYLITGNTRHFPPFWKQTKVVTGRAFVSIVAPHLGTMSRR